MNNVINANENVIVKQQKSFWKYSRRGGSPRLLRTEKETGN